VLLPVLLDNAPLATSPDDLARHLTQLPSAPRILPRLKRLLDNGNSSLSEIVTFLRLDPGIAARVLQVANSAYYSQGMRCYTIEEAVHRVGYEQVYELVATAAASQILIRRLSAYDLDADELWLDSVACALASELVAESTGIDRDVAYTIGLLHNVGMVVIDEWIRIQLPGLRLPSTGLPYEACEAERARLGFHQAEAGSAILRFWDFPAAMSEPVRWQYLPRGTLAHFELACMLNTAKWLRTVACNSSVSQPLPEPFVLRQAGQTVHSLGNLVQEVRSRLAQVNSLLEANDERRFVECHANATA
jgi:HD-like signal output (HDOD) protein